MSEFDSGPRLEDFRPWLDQSCDVAVADLRLPMTLVAAKEIAGSPRAAGGFELEFLGPSEPVLTQNMVRVTGPGASLDLFLIPFARDAAGMRYVATFF